ncbi:hypothetical protein C1645_831068 [Glomus cerebriforme]|uniref:HMG box domain-containing protein n=1 Tax=Glomus cerebriforme TaxID=658196 RepID=A0A397SMR6_9GLOM|nr:hypothetical protein C1645_831068 [Glomus cerebriforme]
MSDDNNLYIVQYTFPEKPSNKRKKRPPCCFVLFGQAMLKEKPNNTTIADFSKTISEKWQNLTEKERIEWRRLYEINRDYTPELADSTETNREHTPGLIPYASSIEITPELAPYSMTESSIEITPELAPYTSMAAPSAVNEMGDSVESYYVYYYCNICGLISGEQGICGSCFTVLSCSSNYLSLFSELYSQ